jgi:cyanophycin synthetase
MHSSAVTDLFRPVVKLNIRFDAPDRFDTAGVSAWLDHLRPQTVSANRSFVLELESEQDPTRAYVRCGAELAQTLAQLIRLPLFDAVALINVSLPQGPDQTGERGLAELEIRALDFIALATLERVFSVAVDLVGWMNGRGLSAANRQAVYDHVFQQVLQPLAASVPGGQSTVPVLCVAHHLGLPFFHLGGGVYQVGFAGKGLRFDRGVVGFDTAVGARFASNKVLTANLLRLSGLPTPLQFLVPSRDELSAQYARMPSPLVVKPADAERGEGVTMDVVDLPGALAAFDGAQVASKQKQVLVEERVQGVCHRFVVVGGEVLYVVKRLPMSVYGDGRQTVQARVDTELQKQQSLAPWNRSPIKPLDARAIEAMNQMGFKPSDVPGIGVNVPLRRIESTADGGIDEDVTTLAHPDNLKLAVDAARAIGLTVAGVDVISTDISIAWHVNGAVVNEVNHTRS